MPITKDQLEAHIANLDRQFAEAQQRLGQAQQQCAQISGALQLARGLHQHEVNGIPMPPPLGVMAPPIP